MLAQVFALLLLSAACLAEDNTNDVTAPEETVDEDPCAELHCMPGAVCTPGPENRYRCECAPSCPDDHPQVCSQANVTFTSLCELQRQHCLCLESSSSSECRDVEIDYVGACKELEPCSADAAAQFPSRTREWFFAIMEDLANRKLLSPSDSRWAAEARHAHKRWLLPAVWKYCDLDRSPEDNQVTTEELQEIIVNLKSYEPCLLPFLRVCDADQDDKITLQEWGTCLGMDHKEIAELQNHCEKMRKKLDV